MTPDSSGRFRGKDGAEVHPWVHAHVLDALDATAKSQSQFRGKRITRTNIAATVLTAWADNRLVPKND